MRIRQAAIAVTVPVRVEQTYPDEVSAYSGRSFLGWVQRDDYDHDLLPEVVDAIRAAVDWDDDEPAPETLRSGVEP